MVSVEVKHCFKCNSKLPLGEFGKCARNSDGLRADCKKCTNAGNRRVYKKRPPAVKNEHQKRYVARNPIKRAAVMQLNYAVKKGEIQRKLKCEECGSKYKIEAHHDDYSKPLEVRWLCTFCHHKWHRENK